MIAPASASKFRAVAFVDAKKSRCTWRRCISSVAIIDARREPSGPWSSLGKCSVNIIC